MVVRRNVRGFAHPFAHLSPDTLERPCYAPGMMPPVESYNELRKPSPLPLPIEAVSEVMRRAASQLGKPCHLWPTMHDLQRRRSDGWVMVGAVGEIESGQAYQVWVHRETGEGRLHAYEMVPGGGVRPRRFEE